VLHKAWPIGDKKFVDASMSSLYFLQHGVRYEAEVQFAHRY